MLTRDSWLFSWVTVIGSFAAQLALGPSPKTWDWSHWMAEVVTLTGLILAKFGNSPLASSADAQKVTVKP